MHLSTYFPLLSVLAVTVHGDNGPTGAIRLRGKQQQQRQLMDNDDKCHDLPRAEGRKWYDSESFFHDCEWYGEEPDRCDKYGSEHERFGYTAQQACCVCESQDFKRGGYSFPDGTIEIQHGTECVTMDGTPDDGTNVIMAECDGKDSQKWIIDESISYYPPNDPVLIVKSKLNSEFCLEASKTGQTPTNMQVWSCKDEDKKRYNQEMDTKFWLEHKKLLTNSGYCLTWENFKDDTKADMDLAGEDKGDHKESHCKTDDIPEFAFVEVP